MILGVAGLCTAFPVILFSMVATLPTRILVVDDDAAVARLAARVLDSLGAVTVLTSGREAIHELRQAPAFDLVVCDMELGDLSGADVYHAALAVDAVYVMRFMFVTGGAKTDRSREFLDANADIVLLKPVAPGKLVDFARARLEHILLT